MSMVATRGGIFGSTTLYGGGLFDGTQSGFGAVPYESAAAGIGQVPFEQAAAGIGAWEPVEVYRDGVFGDRNGMLRGAPAAYGYGPLNDEQGMHAFRNGSLGWVDEGAAHGIGEWERVESYRDGVFMDRDGMLRGELQAYQDGSLGQWSEQAGEKWLGGIGQTRTIDCVHCSCDDPDCLVACPGCASELARVDCASCSCSKPDCAVSCSKKCSPINCTTCDCDNPTCQTWCQKCKWKYPWMIFSEDTVDLQNEINDCLRAKGRCPLPKADGKMGPLTCGAARFCGMDNVLVTCQSFTEPGICQPTTPPPPPPPRACDPGFELVGGDCVPLSPVKTPKKGISTAWIVGGLVGAAVIAGIYAATRKKAA